MVLVESAKRTFGEDKVYQMCESLVHLYFFRGRSATNGQQWMENVRSLYRQGTCRLVVQSDYDTFLLDGCQRAPAHFVGGLAGMSVEGFLNALQKYDTMFQTEMKERGFHLTIGGSTYVTIAPWQLGQTNF